MTQESEKIKKMEMWERRQEKLEERCLTDEEYVLQRYAFRGSIYLVEFGENIGVEISKKRPALVVSKNHFNKYSGNVIVVPLTKNLIKDDSKNLPKYPQHYFIYKSRYPFLDFDSCAECEQVRAISKMRVRKFLGNLSPHDVSIISKKLSKFIS
ncbi:type II toxin-antitoxin system PemK/MazF family toxin [Lentilactobacillus kefiri]|uniref:Type II toxin-antitoxin system PemK/MazF family toxin n=1 Tax=Lentilactobacillus kefiri TaxID=33962 RepID=A0A511DX71_LENKE|nr:type II toxin-antitoxin system PemK/MazF family toxin [Lentilactobacillus kefiri]GEL29442.1 hypothetical protein LKE01_22620 [Lentilactobacillus kefiri]